MTPQERAQKIIENWDYPAEGTVTYIAEAISAAIAAEAERVKAECIRVVETFPTAGAGDIRMNIVAELRRLK
jgi:hypothetical protein